MDYLIHIAVYFTIFSITGMSLNLIVGYTGLFSITHASFYGIGAYTTALLLTRLGAGFMMSVALGVLITFAAALLVGMVLSRFSDDYFAIVSLGFSTIVFAVLLNWQGLTRGGQGIFGVPRASVFGYRLVSNADFLMLSTAFFVVTFFICRFIVNSSFGRVLKAIREDEAAVRIFGYNTVYYKLAIFVTGSMMAAAAGSLYASYIGYIDPSVSGVNESIFMFVIIILGGLGNLYGPLLGAVFLILLPEGLRYLGLPVIVSAKIQEFIYGMVLTALMLCRPQGLVGEYKP
ncbi:MAG: branched-chain amino acid ABC transporter permease [Deferribacteres bacterium]|nr:branched-chain amino acid ABC transporter permease [Deferribacteres bacterium]